MLDNNKNTRLGEALESVLEQGETVSWKGEPAKIDLLAAPHGAMIILRWAVCFVILLFMLWFALFFNSDVNNTSNVWVFVILVIAALGYISVRPIIDMFTIQQNTVFCITNTRVIVFLLKSQIKVKYVFYKEVAEFDIDMLSDKCGNIYIGSRAPNSLRMSRFDNLTFPGEGDQPVRPLVLYNIESPYKVVEFLK